MSTTLSDQDADTHEAIASTRPATQIRSNPDEHWRPSKIDAEMAAASVGVGIVSGLVAGGVMWWAIGQHHPYLTAIGRRLWRLSTAA
ncbi:hypothetical protein [Mycobacteroides abscessus]|uniref:hypothetical protein n=1 Tax=Mycobacteroides abscessus TaxID=36809 RepID=UPI00092730D9|nr:hypothetical protein [Mycobacteroides abscessus]MDO3032110.1 hypothetical protein [Mycobacteroides abscessus subsp. massiliense]SIH56732.1 Uncharacterised protein [Mycobacteroides abscessus subsp. abscessus]SKU68036.1 Uncharacterised protein [Mycobacteroides abscessus subsp. massiliense]